MSILNSLLERRQYVSKYDHEIMYHGTTNKFLKSILSNGMLPSTKDKVWADDPDSNFYSASRKSYGGTYLTNNLVTALSSGRNAVNKLGGDSIIVVICRIQPKSALPDEDKFYGLVDSSLNYAVTDKGKYNPIETFFISAYWEYLHKSERFKQMVSDFIEKFQQVSTTDNFWPTQHNNPELLNAKMENLFVAAVMRKMSYIDKYDIKRTLSRETDEDWDNLDKYTVFDKNKGEQDYARALDELMNSLKSQAFKQNKDFNKTYRVTDPIGFHGRNKIVSVVELKNYMYGNGKIQMIVWYGNPPPKFEDQFKHRLGYKYDIEYRN